MEKIKLNPTINNTISPLPENLMNPPVPGLSSKSNFIRDVEKITLGNLEKGNMNFQKTFMQPILEEASEGTIKRFGKYLKNLSPEEGMAVSHRFAKWSGITMSLMMATIEVATAENKTKSATKVLFGSGTACAAAKSGAFVGVRIGSMINPLWGTIIGGVGGAVVGGIGYWVGSKFGESLYNFINTPLRFKRKHHSI